MTDEKIDPVNYIEQQIEKLEQNKQDHIIILKSPVITEERKNDSELWITIRNEQILVLTQIFNQFYNADQNQLAKDGLKTVYNFEKDHFYLVKALDHFTGQNKVMYFNTMGCFLDQDENYYFFQSYFYGQTADEQDDFDKPMATAILKGTIVQALEMVAKTESDD